jgi:Flp pilus assembly protein TadD
MSSSTSRVLLPLTLVLVGAAIYANSLDGPFLLDDGPAIVDNPSIRQLWPPWQALQAPPDAPGAGRPIVSLSLAVNYALGGLEVRGYHLFNIAVHVLAALTLYGCVRRTLELPALREQFRDPSPALAFSVALLWLVHPLQTEPVNYITQRSESLMGLFLLLTVLLFVRSVTDRPTTTYRTATVLACAAGMACKETMAVAPLLVLLYDRAFVAGDFKSALQARRTIYLGLAATWVWLGFLIATGPDYRAMAMGFDIEIGARDYALAQPEIIVGYLQRVFWPHPLIVDYGQVPPLNTGRLIVFSILLVALVVGSIAALIYRKRLGFLGAWFFLLLAPSSSIVPISSEVGAERRIYLPLVALIVLFVIGLFLGLQRAISRRSAPSGALTPQKISVLIVLVLALALAAVTIRRNRDYRSVDTIWRTVVEVRPGWRAHNNLGAELLRQQRIDEALHHLRRATELGQYLPETWSNLGSALQQLGRTEKALDAHREALKLDPDRSETHNNLAISYGTLGRTDAAIRHFREALRLDPANATAHYNLAILLHISGRRGQAILHYRDALRLDPSSTDALLSLIRALVEEGRSVEARAYLEELLRREPGHRQARELLDQMSSPE